MKSLVAAALIFGACSPVSGFHPPDGQGGSGADAPGLPPDGNGDGSVPTDGATAAWTWQTLIANPSFQIGGCPHTGSSTTCNAPSYSSACAQIPITSEMWIDGFRPGSNGVSDLASDFQSDVPTDDHRFIIVSANGCGGSEISYTWNRGDEIIYAAGLGSNSEVVFPHGMAVHVMPTDAHGNPQYLVIFDRLVNYYKTTTMYGSSQVEAHISTTPPAELTAVDMVLGGQATFTVPYTQTQTVGGKCTPIGTSGYQWNIVGVWPHMHASGTHSTVSIVRDADGSTQTLYDANFTYKDEQTHFFDTPVTLGQYDQLQVDCDIWAQSEALSYDEIQPERDLGRTVCWTGIYKYPTGADTMSGMVTGPEACVTSSAYQYLNP